LVSRFGFCCRSWSLDEISDGFYFDIYFKVEYASSIMICLKALV
jgi:hypothetical protein